MSIGALCQDDSVNTASSNGGSPPAAQYRLYGYRWVILVVYAIATLCNDIGLFSFASIADTTMKAYGISETTFLISSMVNVIVYLPMTVPASYILNKYGAGVGITIAMGLTIVGCWIAVLINYGFWITIVGQIIMSMGQPLILNCVSQVSNTWFAQGERAYNTTLASIAVPAGLIAAYLIPPAFVKPEYADYDLAKIDIRNALICEGVVITTGCIVVLALFRGKPPIPPNASAVAEKVEFKKSFVALFTNWNYIWVFVVFFTMCATFNCIASLIGQFTSGYGFSDSDGGWFGTCLTVFGIIGSAISGALLAKTKRFRLLNFISALVTTLGRLISNSRICGVCAPPSNREFRSSHGWSIRPFYSALWINSRLLRARS